MRLDRSSSPISNSSDVVRHGNDVVGRKHFLAPLIFKDFVGLFLILLWRSWIAQRWGLGSDEAHYALYGRHLDWSYFDHPPLIGWIEALAQFVFQSQTSTWVVRTPAIFAGFLTSILIAKLMIALKQDAVTARRAMWLSNILFLPTALWIMPLPDTLLIIFCLWLYIWMLRKQTLMERDPFEWVELGIVLGLAGLSKYSAVLLIITLLIWVKWKKLKVPLGRLLIAIAVAGLSVLPVFYWNWQNHWISFQYQGGHVLGANGLDWNAFFGSILSQILVYGPFLLPLTFWKVRQNENAREVRRWLIIFLLPMWIFFFLSGLKGFILPHWTFVVYVIWISCMCAINIRRYTWHLVGIQTLIVVVCLAELAFPFIPFPDGQSPYADLVGWNEINARIVADQHEHPSSKLMVGVPNWTLGSRARFYLEKNFPVFVLDDRFDQFDLWERGQARTDEIIVIEFPGFRLDDREKAKCATYESIAELPFFVNAHRANTAVLYRCPLKGI